MLILITAFKKFKLEDYIYQKSALYSWKFNNFSIIASNNEGGLSNNINENVKLMENIKTAKDLGFKNNAPIVNDLILKGLQDVGDDMVGLINSDIILLSDFSILFDMVIKKYGQDMFIACTRYNIKLDHIVDSFETYSKMHLKERTIYDEQTSADIFITSKANWEKLIKDMPDFIMGRYAWDTWILMYAGLNFRCYNGTEVLKTLHPIHDHSHIKEQEGLSGKFAPSSAYNIELWEKTRQVYGNPDFKHWEKCIIN
jgi:hypothetical protein